jgi:hypothetical protein
MVRHLMTMIIIHVTNNRLTAMLNHNKGVHLLAEPLISLAGPKMKDPVKEVSAKNELNLLKSSIAKLQENHEPYSIIGFNEKFVSPKYALPSTPDVLKKFESYLKDNDFRSVRHTNSCTYDLNLVDVI